MAAVVSALKALLAGRPNGQVVAACLAAGAATFFLAAWALRAPELAELLGSMREKLKKPRP
jgi:hypothetical protein